MAKFLKSVETLQKIIFKEVILYGKVFEECGNAHGSGFD